ncbi:2Fe-2S ferredoxin [Diplonema papillatum]|nr:2Fe-2S ferredoxin [Diplonema papillatum]
MLRRSMMRLCASATDAGAAAAAAGAAAAGAAAAGAAAPLVSFTVARGRQKWGVVAPVGERLHEAMKEQGVDIACTCEGFMSCSTCHVYLPQDVFEKVPPVEDFEEDMLEIALERQDNSRLSCCLRVSPVLEGQTLELPKDVFDYYDGW